MGGHCIGQAVLFWWQNYSMIKTQINLLSGSRESILLLFMIMRYLILENIRSAHNVGSLFRTADGAGVNKIFLVGYTPKPVDRFGRLQSEIQKTSLGATSSVEWESRDDMAELLQELKKENVTVVAVEQAKGSVSLEDFTPPEQVAYILGNEIDGVSAEATHTADTILELPMRGEKESLNVAVTGGIVLYRYL